jgi:hypothetical protein
MKAEGENHLGRLNHLLATEDTDFVGGREVLRLTKGELLMFVAYSCTRKKGHAITCICAGRAQIPREICLLQNKRGLETSWRVLMWGKIKLLFLIT